MKNEEFAKTNDLFVQRDFIEDFIEAFERFKQGGEIVRIGKMTLRTSSKFTIHKFSIW